MNTYYHLANTRRHPEDVASKKLRTDWLTLSLVAIYFAVFKLVCIPKELQQGLKVCCVYFAVLFIVTNLRGSEYRSSSLPFCFMVVVSSLAGYLAGYVDVSNYTDAIFYAICLYVLALLISTCCRTDRIDTFISVFFWMTALYCALSVVFIIEVGTSDSSLLYYFAGNKFSTSYYFIMLACFAFAKMQRGDGNGKAVVLVTVLLGGLALAVSLKVHCATAAAMSALVIVLAFVPLRVQRVLSSPAVVIAAMVLTGVILAFLAQILQIPSVRHIVVDVLGKSLTLTGRILIYDALQVVISQSPVLGYGYGNTVVAMFVGYGNAQNSIMETIVNYGLLGLCALFYMVWVNIRGSKAIWSWGMFILLYAMIVGSVVEITYNYFFFTALMTIAASRAKRDDVLHAAEGVCGRPGFKNCARR